MSLIVLTQLLIWLFSGEKDIPGLTDSTVPRRLGPKRASKIRKLFNLAKEDDVRQYVVRRPLTKEGKMRTCYHCKILLDPPRFMGSLNAVFFVFF